LGIAERIKKARKVAGLTQKDVADKMGVFFTLISQYERGIITPKVEQLQKIADALGVPLYNLIAPDDPEELDREYELIYDTLHGAGFNVAQGVMADSFYVTPIDTDDPEMRKEINYFKLAEIVRSVLAEADKKQKEYIEKRLALELFGWRY